MLDIEKLIPPERTEEYAYKMGFDCAVNGANTTNCHFSIFASKDKTKAWETGKQDGEKCLS